MIRSDGFEVVEKEMTGFLKRASVKGSGDDITVGIIKRIEERDLDSVTKKMNPRISQMTIG